MSGTCSGRFVISSIHVFSGDKTSWAFDSIIVAVDTASRFPSLLDPRRLRPMVPDPVKLPCAIEVHGSVSPNVFIVIGCHRVVTRSPHLGDITDQSGASNRQQLPSWRYSACRSRYVWDRPTPRSDA